MRESGYYRVKYYGEWYFGLYDQRIKDWFIASYSEPFFEDQFESIDENRIDPEPQWAMMKRLGLSDEDMGFDITSDRTPSGV